VSLVDVGVLGPVEEEGSMATGVGRAESGERWLEDYKGSGAHADLGKGVDGGTATPKIERRPHQEMRRWWPACGLFSSRIWFK
jgi:hypothetical protein